MSEVIAPFPSVEQQPAAEQVSVQEVPKVVPESMRIDTPVQTALAVALPVEEVAMPAVAAPLDEPTDVELPTSFNDMVRVAEGAPETDEAFERLFALVSETY